MKRLISISVFVLCSVLFHPLRAQDTMRVEDFRLQEVEVNGVQTMVKAPQAVTIIEPDQIASLPISNVSDLLACLPGLDVRSRGTSNAQTDISLYGGTFDQVLVLLNGIPLNDAQTGHYTMNLPVSSALIHHIEVLTGNEQPGAFTGAVNIVTRDTWQDQYTLQMDAGTNADIHPLFAGSWCRGDARFNTSAEYARSDGYYAPTSDTKEQAALRNTGYQLANLYFQTRLQNILDIQAGAQYKDAGLGTGYGFASTDQFDATRTLFASANYKELLTDCWQLKAQAAYRGQYDRYEWHRGSVMNRHWTHSAQASLSATYDTYIIGETSFGIDVKDDYINSTNMGIHNRLHVSLSAAQDYKDGPWKASLHVAGHYNTLFGWYGSGTASFGYTKTGWGVAVNAGRSLRMPTWTDLFYHAGAQRGNTDLKAEKAWTLALNGYYNRSFGNEGGQLSFTANLFYRWGQDIIDWTFDPTDNLFHATNQNKVNTFGLELNANYHLNKWLKNVSLRYAYTNLSLDVATEKSNYLDYLRHKAILNIDHGIYIWSKGCVGANWSLRWQDREGTYVDIYGTPGNPYTPVLLLDGSIYMEIAHVRVSLDCTNMTNRHYYDYGGVLEPGAHGRLSVHANF